MSQCEANRKLKLSFLGKILQERNGENHGIIMPEIVVTLAEYKNKAYCYVGRRQYELAGIKLRGIVVWSSYFVFMA